MGHIRTHMGHIGHITTSLSKASSKERHRDSIDMCVHTCVQTDRQTDKASSTHTGELLTQNNARMSAGRGAEEEEVVVAVGKAEEEGGGGGGTCFIPRGGG